MKKTKALKSGRHSYQIFTAGYIAQEQGTHLGPADVPDVRACVGYWAISYTARGSKFSFFRRVIGYTKALFSGMLE